MGRAFSLPISYCEVKPSGARRKSLSVESFLNGGISALHYIDGHFSVLRFVVQRCAFCCYLMYVAVVRSRLK